MSPFYLNLISAEAMTIVEYRAPTGEDVFDLVLSGGREGAVVYERRASLTDSDRVFVMKCLNCAGLGVVAEDRCPCCEGAGTEESVELLNARSEAQRHAAKLEARQLREDLPELLPLSTRALQWLMDIRYSG